MGGTNISKQAISQFQENVVLASIDIINRNVSNNSSTVEVNQTIRLVLDNTDICGSINLEQNVSTINFAFSRFDSNNKTEVQSEIRNTFEAAVNNAIQQVNEKLNLGQNNEVVTDVSLVQTQFTQLSESIVNEVEQKLTVNTVVNQGITIEITDSVITTCLPNQTSVPIALNVVQKVDIRQILESAFTVDNSVRAITDIVNNLDGRVDNAVLQRNTGVAPLSFLSGLGFLALIMAFLPIIMALLSAVGFLRFIAPLLKAGTAVAGATKKKSKKSDNKKIEEETNNGRRRRRRRA